MTEQPGPRSKRIHGGWQTVFRSCSHAECGLLYVEGKAWEHGAFHQRLDDLEERLAQLEGGRAAAPEWGEAVTVEGLAARPGSDDEPLPGRASRALDRIAAACADAWLAVFPRRPPAVMPPPTIPAAMPRPDGPAPVPVPSYVAEQARRQVERATQPRE